MNRKDSHRRSLLKALVYKVGSVTVLAVLSWIFTRSWTQMTAITISYELIAIIGYYVHERLWEHINWGRQSEAQK